MLGVLFLLLASEAVLEAVLDVVLEVILKVVFEAALEVALVLVLEVPVVRAAYEERLCLKGGGS